MKDVVIYVRSASHNEQSIRAQLESCREYAKLHGYNVVAEFSDNGFSGMNFDRSGFAAMNECRDKWQAVIVYSIEKLSRNTNDRYQYEKSLRDCGKELISITESCSEEVFNMLEIFQENIAMRKTGVQS